MNHPYREPIPARYLFKEWNDATACWSCERRAALAAERKRRAWHALGVALLATHSALAGVAIACIQLDSRMLAEANKVDADAVEALRLARQSTTTAPTPPAGPPAALASPPPLPVPDVPEWPIGLGLVQLSATEFIVDRRSLAVALQRQADLMRSARVVPESENGRVVGIRLFGVTPSSLLGRFGFENHDRLESINGVDLCTPGRALKAYSRFRTSSEVYVIVSRRGSKVRLEYHIV